MSNKIGTLGALILASVAMVCGTVLMLFDKLNAASAWPALLAAVIVPSIGILLGQQLTHVSATQASQGEAITDVQAKVNGRMTELIAAVAGLSDRLNVDPQLTHPENAVGVAEARSAGVTLASVPTARGPFSPVPVTAASPVDPATDDDGEPVPPDGPTD